MDSPSPRESTGLLTVTATSEQGVAWIVVRGEVDLANREQLRRDLAAIDLGRAGAVYLDLRLLRFCDSAGCRILLRFTAQARASGYDVRIHRARPIVRKVMSIVGEPPWG
jgi:anti-anti-sigma factor